MPPSRARCPHCKKPVETDLDRRPSDFPFCSQRCRLLDLHKWLSGHYRIPVTAPTPVERTEGDER
ncbi:MAG: DNA gyrase inhibitor YacG [Planctomycetota bacterium]